MAGVIRAGSGARMMRSFALENLVTLRKKAILSLALCCAMSPVAALAATGDPVDDAVIVITKLLNAPLPAEAPVSP